ncbi:class I SAM-dependent methyltransferase, partial [Halorubrum sp. SS5]
LFSPDRLREAAIGTGWTVEAVDRSGSGEGPHYRAALRKR